jgi:hypothetical protein
MRNKLDSSLIKRFKEGDFDNLNIEGIRKKIAEK